MNDQYSSKNPPGYGALHHYEGRNVVIMGNTVQVPKDGTQWIWAADWITGVRVNAALSGLSAPRADSGRRLRKLPQLEDVATRVMAWASNGDGDAMWWLGDFFECGSREIPADGGRALAYYMGAIRAEPDAYDRDTIGRIFEDGRTLFQARRPVGDTTTSDITTFLLQFEEFRDIQQGLFYYPDRKAKNWKACIAIADRAGIDALSHPYWKGRNLWEAIC